MTGFQNNVRRQQKHQIRELAHADDIPEQSEVITSEKHLLITDGNSIQCNPSPVCNALTCVRSPTGFAERLMNPPRPTAVPVQKSCRYCQPGILQNPESVPEKDCNFLLAGPEHIRRDHFRNAARVPTAQLSMHHAELQFAPRNPKRRS